jgi:hypothetical protein
MDDRDLVGAEGTGRRRRWALLSDELRVFGLLALLVPIYALFQGLLARDLGLGNQTPAPQTIEVPVTVRIPIEVPVEQIVFVPVPAERGAVEQDQAVARPFDVSPFQNVEDPTILPIAARPLNAGEANPPTTQPEPFRNGAPEPGQIVNDGPRAADGPPLPVGLRPSDSTAPPNAPPPALGPHPSLPQLVSGPIAFEVRSGLPDATVDLFVPAPVDLLASATASRRNMEAPALVAERSETDRRAHRGLLIERGGNGSEERSNGVDDQRAGSENALHTRGGILHDEPGGKNEAGKQIQTATSDTTAKPADVTSNRLPSGLKADASAVSASGPPEETRPLASAGPTPAGRTSQTTLAPVPSSRSAPPASRQPHTPQAVPQTPAPEPTPARAPAKERKAPRGE